MEDEMKCSTRKRKKQVREQRPRRKRVENVPVILKDRKTNLLENDQEIGENANSMDPDLYTAAMEGNILEFVLAEEKGPADRQLEFPSACVQVSPQKNTALHIATSFRHHEIVNLICKDLPFFIVEKNSKGDTALHIAARSGDSRLVSLLLNAIQERDIKYLLVEKNDGGNTALHEALQHYHEKVARVFIDKNRDISYPVNEEGKSVLYLAAEAGYVELVRLMMENPVGYNEEKTKKKSPVLAAIEGRSIDILNILWEKDQSAFHSRCEQGRNPLHCAASRGYLEGVNFLLDKFRTATYQSDRNGHFPIHMASDKGYVNIIQEFLRHCPDSRELLNQQGQNLLHVAAKRGKTDVIRYLLKTPTIEKLVNERDGDGNTPLHLATIYQYPKTLSILAQDRRVNLNLKNKEGFAAHDIASAYNINMDSISSFRKRLAYLALRLAYAQRSQLEDFKKNNKRQNPIQGGPSNLERYKENVTIVLLLSTFVATVTFSAAFTVPGGDNNSNPNQGIATMVMNKMFHVFVICNTMAMYSSILVAVTLIWAHLCDLVLMPFALKLALPLLGMALTMTSLAFMAGLYLVVSKLTWLGDVVLFMGLIFLVTLSALFVPLCFLGSSNYYILRYISYYPFRLMLFTLGSYIDDELGD